MTKPPVRSPRPARAPRLIGLALSSLACLSASLTAIGADALPGAEREHLRLPLDAAAWRVTFVDEGDAGSWTYEPAATPPGRMPAEWVNVAASDPAGMPLATRELPQRMHAVIASYAPGTRLDVRHDTPRNGRERLIYVLATGEAADGAVVAMAVDGASAVHTAEIELSPPVDAARIAHWVDVFDRAVLVPAAGSDTH